MFFGQKKMRFAFMNPSFLYKKNICFKGFFYREKNGQSDGVDRLPNGVLSGQQLSKNSNESISGILGGSCQLVSSWNPACSRPWYETPFFFMLLFADCSVPWFYIGVVFGLFCGVGVGWDK